MIDSVKNDKEIEIIVSISLFLYFMICTLFFLWLINIYNSIISKFYMFTVCYSYSLVASTIASIALSNQSTSRLSTSPASLAAAIAGVIGI